MACDTRKDFMQNLDTGPIVTISKLTNQGQPINTPQATMVDSFKLSQTVYNLAVNISSVLPSNQLQLNTNINGGGQLINPNSNLTSASGYNYTTPYTYKPNSIGTKQLFFTVKDPYALTSTAELDLTVFANLPPVALLNVQYVGLLDPRQYQLTASQSYDTDSKYGGFICQYQYDISPNYRVITNLSSINYIFPQAGNYRISVRVQDNDSTWSPSTVTWVNVN